MTPEEYINKVKKDRWDRLSGGWLGTFVTEEDALAAISMARAETKESASEDLEQAANQIVNKAIPTLAQKYKDGTYVGCIRDCFDRKEFIDLVKAGAQWQKEQMLKDAIEGKVMAVRTTMSDKLHTYPWIELEAQLSKNDKVKVIIIKE